LPRVLSKADIADFRDRLCDAAEKLFAEHGLEAVTMRQLAAVLGVSPMTPYRYFADKDAILAAVRARAFDRHGAALETAFHNTQGDRRAKSKAMGQAYVSFALENPDAYRLMFDIDQPTATQYPELVKAAARSHSTMTLHLREMMAAGEFKGDPDVVGHMYWASLHGPIMLHLSGMLAPNVPLATLTRSLQRAIDQQVFGPG
jgi:AcrR family transcriptional regulator